VLSINDIGDGLPDALDPRRVLPKLVKSLAIRTALAGHNLFFEIVIFHAVDSRDPQCVGR
jgi:hypothetical protein